MIATHTVESANIFSDKAPPHVRIYKNQQGETTSELPIIAASQTCICDVIIHDAVSTATAKAAAYLT